MKVREFLVENGIFPNLKGFYPIIRAVEIVKKKGKISMMKELYPQLAKEFNTSMQQVERNMRHIIQDKISPEQYAQYGIKIIPSTGEFIYYFADGGKKWIV